MALNLVHGYYFFWQSLLPHILSTANHPTTRCETTAIDIPNPEAVKGKTATQEFVDGLLNNTVSSSDYTVLYRVSQEECARLREGVPYVKVYRYSPKHLCPKLNGYGNNGQRSLKL